MEKQRYLDLSLAKYPLDFFVLCLAKYPVNSKFRRVRICLWQKCPLTFLVNQKCPDLSLANYTFDFREKIRHVWISLWPNTREVKCESEVSWFISGKLHLRFSRISDASGFKSGKIPQSFYVTQRCPDLSLAKAPFDILIRDVRIYPLQYIP